MGAFFLVKNNLNYQEQKVKDLFRRKGFSAPIQVQLQHWHLYYFKKIKDSISGQVYLKGDFTLIICGTLIYKSNTCIKSGETLLNDLTIDRIDYNQIIGTFVCISLYKDEKIKIFSDNSNIYNIFYDEELNLFSSSFLAIQAARKENLINKNAALENVLTGQIIGPETLIHGIQRLEPEFKISLDTLEVCVLKPNQFHGYYKGSASEAIDYQISVLSDYFKSVRNYAIEQGSDSGLTSGFDSRLILALILKFWDNFQVHSHYRKAWDKEIQIAAAVAKKACLKQIQIPVKYPEEMGNEEFEDQLEKSYLFCDGLIRTHGFWTEEYNTGSHRLQVLGDKNLGISGIGGEQYRNCDNLISNNHSWHQFIKNSIIINSCGSCFHNKRQLNELVERICNKAGNKLHLGPTTKVTKLEIKRYWNEIFIPARLGGRNNAENQVSFFLSPFSDNKVSIAAYEVIPFLDLSWSFQMKMIKKLSPELAMVTSDYGYSFDKKMPMDHILKNYVKAIVPHKIKQLYVSYHFFRLNNPYWPRLLKNQSIISQLVCEFNELGFNVRTEALLQRPDVMPLLLQLGYVKMRL
jgi:hypothetical protein